MREANEKGVWYKGRFCPVGSTLYRNDTIAFYRGGLVGLARSVKCDDSLAIVVEQDADSPKHYNDK